MKFFFGAMLIILLFNGFYHLGFKNGKNTLPIIATAEKQEIINSYEMTLSPEMFTGFKDGDWVVCNPNFGNGKMTLLFTFNGRAIKADHIVQYPRMMLFNYALTQEEIDLIAGVKLKTTSGN